MQETQCRACASTLLLDLSLDGSPGAEDFSARKQVRLESNASEDYVRCPYCSAKNIAMVRTHPDGSKSVELILAVIDDP